MHLALLIGKPHGDAPAEIQAGSAYGNGQRKILVKHLGSIGVVELGFDGRVSEDKINGPYASPSLVSLMISLDLDQFVFS